MIVEKELKSKITERQLYEFWINTILLKLPETYREKLINIIEKTVSSRKNNYQELHPFEKEVKFIDIIYNLELIVLQINLFLVANNLLKSEQRSKGNDYFVNFINEKPDLLFDMDTLYQTIMLCDNLDQLNFEQLVSCPCMRDVFIWDHSFSEKFLEDFGEPEKLSDKYKFSDLSSIEGISLSPKMEQLFYFIYQKRKPREDEKQYFGIVGEQQHLIDIAQQERPKSNLEMEIYKQFFVKKEGQNDITQKLEPFAVHSVYYLENVEIVDFESEFACELILPTHFIELINTHPESFSSNEHLFATIICCGNNLNTLNLDKLFECPCLQTVKQPELISSGFFAVPLNSRSLTIQEKIFFNIIGGVKPEMKMNFMEQLEKRYAGNVSYFLKDQPYFYILFIKKNTGFFDSDIKLDNLIKSYKKCSSDFNVFPIDALLATPYLKTMDPGLLSSVFFELNEENRQEMLKVLLKKYDTQALAEFFFRENFTDEKTEYLLPYLLAQPESQQKEEILKAICELGNNTQTEIGLMNLYDPMILFFSVIDGLEQAIQNCFQDFKPSNLQELLNLPFFDKINKPFLNLLLTSIKKDMDDENVIADMLNAISKKYGEEGENFASEWKQTVEYTYKN